MKIFDQEHYDLMIQFEREHSGRFDKEAKEFWPKGIVYQDGRINELFLAYLRGYAFCEADMRSDIQNLEASRDGYRSEAQRNSRDAARYQAWRDQMITGNQEFRQAIAAALPKEVGDIRPPTAAEWDAAIDAAIAAQRQGDA